MPSLDSRVAGQVIERLAAKLHVKQAPRIGPQPIFGKGTTLVVPKRDIRGNGFSR
jgi:hypothetical protein